MGGYASLMSISVEAKVCMYIIFGYYCELTESRGCGGERKKRSVYGRGCIKQSTDCLGLWDWMG